MMKRAAVLFPLFLAACGGGSSTPAPEPKSESVVSGTVSGLPQGATLLLSNSGKETIAVSANGSFAFPARIAEGTAYNVAIVGEPSGSGCSVANGSGVAAHGQGQVAAVAIACSTGAVAMVQFNVGVTVSGLAAGQSLVLTNNSADTVTATRDGLFVFPTYYFRNVLYSGRAGGYDVTIATPPAGQTCTLANASGANASTDGNFVNVTATCK
jgi:hypothetical protein